MFHERAARALGVSTSAKPFQFGKRATKWTSVVRTTTVLRRVIRRSRSARGPYNLRASSLARYSSEFRAAFSSHAYIHIFDVLIFPDFSRTYTPSLFTWAKHKHQRKTLSLTQYSIKLPAVICRREQHL